MNLPSRLVSAAESLAIVPRGVRWRSLSFCIVDAVWSVGSKYEAVVAPLTRKLAKACGVEEPLTTNVATYDDDPVPLPAFRELFATADDLIAETNRQLTSTRGGISKAEAALRYADVLLEGGIMDLAAAGALLNDDAGLANVTRGLRRIPGRGVREGYFWMLVGASDVVKPDRHILKWLRENGLDFIDVPGARVALAELAEHLSANGHRLVSPWELDHAVWEFHELTWTGLADR